MPFVSNRYLTIFSRYSRTFFVYSLFTVKGRLMSLVYYLKTSSSIDIITIHQSGGGYRATLRWLVVLEYIKSEMIQHKKMISTHLFLPFYFILIWRVKEVMFGPCQACFIIGKPTVVHPFILSWNKLITVTESWERQIQFTSKRSNKFKRMYPDNNREQFHLSETHHVSQGSTLCAPLG